MLLTAIAIWSLNFSVMKVGIGELSPLAFPIFRFGLGALVMLVLLRHREGSVRFDRRDLGLFVTVGFVGITLNQLCAMFALTFTTAADVALLSATQPIFTAGLVTLMGDESLGRGHWVAVGLGMLGVVFVVGGSVATEGGSGGPAVGVASGWPLLTALPVGDLLALGVSLTAAISAILIRRLLDRYSPYRILTIQMVLGTCFLLPLAAPSLVSQDYAAVAPIGWAALAYSAVLAGVVTNLLYFTGIRRVGPSRAAVYQYLQSFLGVIFAVLLLAEPLGPIQVIGGVVIVASVALSRHGPGGLLARAGAGIVRARASLRTGRSRARASGRGGPNDLAGR